MKKVFSLEKFLEYCQIKDLTPEEISHIIEYFAYYCEEVADCDDDEFVKDEKYEEHLDKLELKEDENDDEYFSSDEYIGYIQKSIHQNAVKHGWWEEDRNFGELIALCHSELSEALEEVRKGKKPNETYYSEGNKPEGVPSELADVIIRILDMCEHYGIDMQSMIYEKHQYNKTRPYKHGKQF